ncbi:hypothetical protein ACFOLH_13640 [Aquipuribacter hungaricus]|uniref:Ig-like domain-containing protein n=2 Tax=Aquipuribacter hungaricus TaxID=545624 RepID=A0ABV7WIZ8_9MICO
MDSSRPQPPPVRVPRPRSPSDPRRPGSPRARRGPAAASLLVGALLLTAAPAHGGRLPGPVAPAPGPSAAPGPPEALAPGAPEQVACLVVGTSRAGRAWLPRARVLVPGLDVLAVRTATPHARVSTEAGLVQVQRTSRHGGGRVVRLEVAVRGPEHRGTWRSVVCEVVVAPPADGRAAPDGGAHGARRLVRAD